MWIRWLPWKWMLRRMARAQGFLDPITVFSNIRRFSKPSQIIAPTELLRAAAVLHARGLINTQAIQQNPDWIWPFWVERQFDPKSDSFVPRAFTISHINLTHRNWTAVGIPDNRELPIIDPRGLVTPFFDGWSLDIWCLSENDCILPSREAKAVQELLMNGGLSVRTGLERGQMKLESEAQVLEISGQGLCRIRVSASSMKPGRLVVSLRPYNPEGISFVEKIESLPGKKGWMVNGEDRVLFSEPWDLNLFSQYSSGDVYQYVSSGEKRPEEREIECPAGMATAAALFEIGKGGKRRIDVNVPFLRRKSPWKRAAVPLAADGSSWKSEIKGTARLDISDSQFEFLYEAAVRTLILHSPDEVYPGPFTYKRFWFRDATFILYALGCVNQFDRSFKVLDGFPRRQTAAGHFLSQDGEWDSNGQALWIMRKICRLSGEKPRKEWRKSIASGARWIIRKRLTREKDALHSGLLPPGFSAEHLGPNDYYYWDDFWGVAGLEAAGELMQSLGDPDLGESFKEEAWDFFADVQRSMEEVAKRIKRRAIPASPYRRLDPGAIGSLAIGYPTELCDERDPALLDTVKFLLEECFLDGGFYQEITHSGINAYLTLHVSQVLLRAGDPRCLDILKTVGALATSTGQWPEAIHPRLHSGCMGDGQHVWAAAEWVLMIRNAFVKEERREPGKLILCSGVPMSWLAGGSASFGPASTHFGPVTVKLDRIAEDKVRVSCEAHWRSEIPRLEVRIPGCKPETIALGRTDCEISVPKQP